MKQPASIPFPLSSFPGAQPQEGDGRLIGCYAEPLGDPSERKGRVVWRGSPGLSQHAQTALAGYRGGLLVKNLAYEIFSGQAATVDVNGVVNVLGTLLGTKKVSLSRDQAASPNVFAVDVDNGAYLLSTGGAPSAYNGGGSLPQPNSVCNQDGYTFFTIADCRVFATALNSTSLNSLTFITVQAKADVTLLRAIPFSGYLFLFTTGHFEVWQDAAIAAPAFPYARMTVGETGLVQPAAIAGWDVGFSELLWVGQDYGVYWLTPGSIAPIKVSPPDLDRLIEAQVKAGNLLEAGCYSEGGKKFWHISSPAWTWEFNVGTKKWNERQSVTAAGIYGRWRATCGHPAFNKWICGDQLTGNLLYHDLTNFTENGAPLRFRIESGPVKEFPEQLRIARADFDFDMGVGQNVGSFKMTVLGAAAGTGGVVRLTVDNTAQAKSGDQVNVAGVTGTTEANGAFVMTVVDINHIELVGTKFVNAYVSGGTAIDVTEPLAGQSPSVAISCSKNGGRTYDNPSIRSLSPQGKIKRQRASVKNRGQAGAMGVRWALEITDPVYRGLLGGTMSANPSFVSP